MKTRTHTHSHSLTSGRSLVIGGALVIALSFAAAAEDHHSHGSASPAKLVDLVRSATHQFVDVNAGLYAAIRLRKRSGSRSNGRSLHQYGTGGRW